MGKQSFGSSLQIIERFTETAVNKGAGFPTPKTSAEKSRTLTAKRDQWAKRVSNGKYETLRRLIKAILDMEAQGDTRVADALKGIIK